MASTARAEKAPAKVNLTLRVLGRRADGYHELESLVAFAGVGDALTFAPGAALALTVSGPTAPRRRRSADNLVLKAARALAERIAGLNLGRFALSKRLPVAAGLGGGSADAAAALRLLAQRQRHRARRSAADAGGAGDRRRRAGLSRSATAADARHRRRPVRSARSAAAVAVLVNPGVAVSTRDVFAALEPRRPPAPPAQAATAAPRRSALLAAHCRRSKRPRSAGDRAGARDRRRAVAC